MKKCFFIVVTILVLLVTLTGNAQATSPTSPETQSLIYVKLDSSDALSRFASTQLLMYAMLDGGLLTGANLAGQGVLEKAGLSFQVIDPDLRLGTYYLAESRSSRPTPDFGLYGQVLLDTANGVLLRMDSSQVDELTQAGAELSLITLTPKPLPTAQSEGIFPEAIDPDPLIQVMIDQVTQESVSLYDRELAGEVDVWVDGGWYTITTRHTDSGTPIQKTTSYVGQHMADLELDVEYHVWKTSSNPNVIGEIQGLVNPDDIFIIGAHIDDVNGTPGADDNASGSVATLIAADILSQYQWGCTLRFAVWTGEEQGLEGSEAYALRASQLGENILGYLNLDMIAWNTIGSQPGIDLLYNPNMPPTMALAQLSADVVGAYEINLFPQLVTSLGGGSDHSSFWNYGYTSILAIEDQGDFNPYYHGPGDTPAHTDLAYFTDFVKAAIGTFAHMSNCLISSGLGTLEGHVTSASGGSPIEGAEVTAQNGDGSSLSAFTDATGYYNQTLISETYTVTASAYSYLPVTIPGVEVISDTTTVQDFSLTPLPVYTVSGYVKDSATNAPLAATVEFLDAPVNPVSTNPATGYYSIDVAEGTWTMKASAELHSPHEENVVVDGNKTQDFLLDPLPCILLVDDDKDGPDVRSYYTDALDDLGYDYNVWDVATQFDPGEADLTGYLQVLWFNGYPYSGTSLERMKLQLERTWMRGEISSSPARITCMKPVLLLSVRTTCI
jgi:hypothetical protein